MLERVAAMGMVYDPAKDDDFGSLRESPRFVGLITEGLAYDPVSRRFFISSVREGAILTGTGRTLITTDLPMGIFGMAVDARRRILWAAAAALPQSKRFQEDSRNKAAVLQIDLKTNKLIGTIEPPDNDKHLFGDLVVADDGACM